MINKKENFNQVCVWPGTLVGETEATKFEAFMLKTHSIHVQYLEEIKTLPRIEQGYVGGRNDLFFAIHNDDVGKFAIPRLQTGIKWIEDVLDNEIGHTIYPDRVALYREW